MKGQKGTAMTEFAVCLPILVIILFSTIELGRAAGVYLDLTRVVYEGVRYGGALPGLEEGEFATANQVTHSGQAELRTRVLTHLGQYGYDTTQAGLISSYTRSVTNGGTTTEDVVTIDVDIPYTPLFPFISGLPMHVRVRASGPYLHRER